MSFSHLCVIRSTRHHSALFLWFMCINRRVYSKVCSFKSKERRKLSMKLTFCIYIANYPLFHFSLRVRKLIGEVQNENDSSHRTSLLLSLRVQLYLPIVRTFSLLFSPTFIVRSEKFSHSTRKHQRLPCSGEVLCTPKIEFKLKNFDKSCLQKGFF